MSLVTVLRVEIGSLAALLVGLNLARESIVFTGAVVVIYASWRIRRARLAFDEARQDLLFSAEKRVKNRRAAAEIKAAATDS